MTDVKREVLDRKWAELYKSRLFNDDFQECDFESLCVGWCLALGLSTDDAFTFYRRQVDDTGNF
jgi:hypothetical protein